MTQPATPDETLRTVRVMVADDHPLINEFVVGMLSDAHDMEVVGVAENAEQLLQRYGELRPDLVICDYSMPGMTGIEVTEKLIQLDPNARVLILTGHQNRKLVQDAADVGAIGFVDKSVHPLELLDMIRTAAAGGSAFSDEAMATLLNRNRRSDPNELTDRQLEVLAMSAAGLSREEIAAQLVLSVETIKTHLAKIYGKLGVKSQREAVARAREEGLIH